MNPEQNFNISELATEFDISTRTIRYYEEIGLLNPKRDGNRRIYTRSDRTRLKLILRGKKFGFSLEEIKEMIQLFDEDRTGKRQLEKTIEYGNAKISEIETRIIELIELRDALTNLKNEFEKKLK